MFTGLIQSVGSVHRRGKSLLVRGCEPFSPLAIGDSISVDGVCLTVKDLVLDGFLADVSEETIEKTTLSNKSDRGGLVNLEPALRFSDRLGGHLVSGHVDGLGEVHLIDELDQSWKVQISWKDKEFDKFICKKASISIDGISLTIAGLNSEFKTFWLAVIPHTFSSTTLNQLQIGDKVNIEVDLMAKYAQKILLATIDAEENIQNKSQLSMEWLLKNGWE